MNYCSYTDGFFQILLKYSYLVTAVVITLVPVYMEVGDPR